MQKIFLDKMAECIKPLPFVVNWCGLIKRHVSIDSNKKDCYYPIKCGENTENCKPKTSNAVPTPKTAGLWYFQTFEEGQPNGRTGSSGSKSRIFDFRGRTLLVGIVNPKKFGRDDCNPCDIVKRLISELHEKRFKASSEGSSCVWSDLFVSAKVYTGNSFSDYSAEIYKPYMFHPWLKIQIMLEWKVNVLLDPDCSSEDDWVLIDNPNC